MIAPPPPARKRTPPALIAAIVVPALLLVAVGGFLLLARLLMPRFETPMPTMHTDKLILRRAAQVWRGTHAADACPSPSQLKVEGAVDPALHLTDDWGTPYAIECTADETTVVSLGPDKVVSSDDIRVPEPSPNPDSPVRL